MSQSVPTIVSLKLLSLGTTSFGLTEEAQKLKERLPDDQMEFTFNIRLKADEREKQISVHLETCLSNNIDSTELCVLKTYFHFAIENFEEIVMRKPDNSIVIYESIVPLFASVALGTTRGIFSTFVANTMLTNAIVPVIDTQQFVNSLNRVEEERI